MLLLGSFLLPQQQLIILSFSMHLTTVQLDAATELNMHGTHDQTIILQLRCQVQPKDVIKASNISMSYSVLPMMQLPKALTCLKSSNTYRNHSIS